MCLSTVCVKRERKREKEREDLLVSDDSFLQSMIVVK